MRRIPTTRGGYTLIEAIVYVGILAAMSLVVVAAMLSLASTSHRLKATRAAEHAATVVLERLIRDARAASAIAPSGSSFGVSHGSLALTAVSGSRSTTTRFTVEDGAVVVDVNGARVGPLTPSSVSVDDMRFYRITTPVSEAVRIDLTVTGRSGRESDAQTYHATVTLKQP